MTDTAASRAPAARSRPSHAAAGGPDAPEPRQPAARLVHDRVPGRRRFLVAGLKGDAFAALKLEQTLPAVEGVTRVEASALTGTVLILTDQAKSVGDLEAAIEAALAEDWTGPAEDSAGERWRSAELSELAKAFGTSLSEGIRPQSAEKRLRLHGANVLSRPVQSSAVEMFVDQVRNLPTALLAVAAAVSVFTGGPVEAAAILGVVALNGLIGYATERRAQRTIESLSRLGHPDATVIRGGRETTVPAEAVAPGDLLVLTRGSIVPADARLVRSNALTASEAALTGESLPVAKSPDRLRPGPVPLAERANMVFRGTLITGGSGTAVVVATGMATQVGVVQRLAGAAAPPETPSQRRLERLGRHIVAIAAGVCGLCFGLGWLRGLGFVQLLRTALSLAIAAVPEGLPTVATTTLALGVEDMRRRGVLVRSLHAIETLSSATVICFDKTGTLTRNEMQVTAIACGPKALQLVSPSGGSDGPLVERLLRTAVLASDLVLEEQDGRTSVSGSSTERALADAAIERGVAVEDLHAALPCVAAEARSEDRRYMTSIHVQGAGRWLAAVKGSPLEVLERCAWEALPEGGRRPLTEARRAQIGRLNADMAARALRVLGVADRELTEFRGDEVGTVVRDLTWIGLVGMADPMREGASEVIARLRAAGLRPVMMTGDQSATARALAGQVELSGERDPVVVDALELEGLAPEQMAEAVARGDVFARVSPEQKLTILRALQGSGAVVAMVGDGVNDSPALRAADVGIALGNRDAAAAQEVADVVLETDDLAGLLKALERGRSTHINIHKAIRYLLSTNGSEIMVMLAALALGLGTALSPMQILWINLISDILPGIGLALEPPEADVLARGPAPEQVVGRSETARLAREAAFMSAGALGACAYGALRYGAEAARTRTMTFASLVGAQLLHGLTCRSSGRGLFTPGRLAPNPALGAVLGLSGVLQAAAFSAPPLRRLLGLSGLGPADVGVTLLAGVLPFLSLEAVKTGAKPGAGARARPDDGLVFHRSASHDLHRPYRA